jgi:GT2 family glycosyltransferase
MPSGSLRLSVVVLSWNRREELRRTLARVCPEACAAGEVVVVDNGSRDGSAEMVRRCFPEVRLLALPENVGIQGLNVGLRAARGEVIVLLDDDSSPLPGTLAQVAAAFRQDPALGIAAGRIDGPPGWWEATWPWDGAERGTEVPTFVGCGAGLRRAALARAGEFDGAFFLYQNELDLAVRVAGSGYTVRYFPEIRFVHAVSPSHRTSRRADYYGLRNLLWILWKYLPRVEAARLGARVVGERAAYCLLRRDLRRLWTVVRGAWAAAAGRASVARRPLPPPARGFLRAYVDLWFPPPLGWARARLAAPRRRAR